MTWTFLERLRDYYFGTIGRTARAPEPPLAFAKLPVFDAQGWSTDHDHVRVIPSRPGWYYAKLDTKDGLPLGIVAHYTATDPGTALGMAIRRRDHDRKEFNPPPGSWHFTVAQNGSIIQQLSIRQGAFHAGSATAKKLPIGWANHVTIGIELEGHGDRFSELQIQAACLIWHDLVQHCGILRTNAMYQHREIDPTRRRDPGDLWMTSYAPRVLDFAYAPPVG